jgi:transposase
VDAALRHGASVILVENLENYRPNLERSARENRSRMRWNVQKIVEFLELCARPLGLRLWKVGPYWSSQFCSACGYPGKRFSIPRKSVWKRFYERRHGPLRKPVLEPGGQFFICSNPSCPRPSGIINADVNAAMNFAAILAGTFERPVGDKNHRTWKGKPLDGKAIQVTCQERLDKHFRSKKDLAEQTPW